MQKDGNFVVYRGDIFKTKPPGYEKTALWSVFPASDANDASGVSYHIYMQEDGNLCICRQPDGAVTYVNADTAHRMAKDGRLLDLGDDGRLDIRGIWNSRVATAPENSSGSIISWIRNQRSFPYRRPVSSWTTATHRT